MDIGLWDEFCKLTGVNPWCCNEGLASSKSEYQLTDEEVTELGIQKTLVRVRHDEYGPIVDSLTRKIEVAEEKARKL